MNFFKLVAFALSAFVVCCFTACNSNQKKSDKLTVAVTLQPYAKILNAIGGERVEVVGLIPAGADPHTFEPKPETIKAFSKASIYMSDGSGIDKNWKNRFLGVNPNVVVANVSEGVVWNTMEEHHHEGEDHNDDVEELDPHLWTSPKVVKVVAANMLKALCAKDTEGCGTYTKNLESYNAKMDSLDARITRIVAGMNEPEKKFMVFHPSFGYLARDYGLTQLAVEVEGKEPKPRDLQELIETAKQNSVKVVFVMPQFSKRAVESIAKEIEGSVQSVDPLAYEFENVLLDFITALSKTTKTKILD